jgi:ribose transport system substrate-binding protein
MRRIFTHHRLSRTSLGLAAAVIVGMTLTGSAYGQHAARPAHAGPYKFVLSNNFLGNDWRPQMERLAALTARLRPFKSKVTLSIVNAQNTTQAQIQSLNAIIATHPDAILLDASSGTALNPTVTRACAAGIKVISFDQPVTAACAWKVSQDHGAGQIVVGEWMAQTLHRSGSIFVDRGLPGAPVSAIIHDNFLKGLKLDGPLIRVAGEYDGQYAPGPEQQGISSLLVAHPNVDGVMTQGYCKPSFNAFRNAGKPAVPTTCYAYNGEMVACGTGGHACAILTGSPVVIQLAMELALKAVSGLPTPSKAATQPVPMTLYVTNRAMFRPRVHNVTVKQIVVGKNCYPRQPAGFALPYTLPRYPIPPGLASGH